MAESRQKQANISTQRPTTVLAIDQSYATMGLGVSVDGTVIIAKSVPLPRERSLARALVGAFVTALRLEHQPDMIVVEKVRTFSGGMISIGSIIALGTLITTVVDSAGDVPVYSVDTRSWKSKVLGAASAKKEDAVAFIEQLNIVDFDGSHDSADAACMSLYPFVAPEPKFRQEY